jgi:hypothetical protein
VLCGLAMNSEVFVATSEQLPRVVTELNVHSVAGPRSAVKGGAESPPHRLESEPEITESKPTIRRSGTSVPTVKAPASCRSGTSVPTVKAPAS